MNKMAFHHVGALLALADVGLVKYASVMGTLLHAGATVARNRAKDKLRDLLGFETPEWRQKQKALARASLEVAKDYAEKIKDYVLPEETEEEEEEEEAPAALIPGELGALFSLVQPPREPELPSGMFAPAEEKAPSLGELAAPTHESSV